MSIVDNIRIKQDWSEDGYEFDKDAKPDEERVQETELPETVVIQHMNVAKPTTEDFKRALEQAQKHIDRMYHGASTGRHSGGTAPHPAVKPKTFKDLIEERQRLTFGPSAKLIEMITNVEQDGDCTTYTHYMQVEMNGRGFLVEVDHDHGPLPVTFEHPRGVFHTVHANDWHGETCTRHNMPLPKTLTVIVPVSVQYGLMDLRAAEQRAVDWLIEHGPREPTLTVHDEHVVAADFETRSAVALDPAVDDVVLCWAYKIGDEPVRTFTFKDWSEGRYVKD